MVQMASVHFVHLFFGLSRHGLWRKKRGGVDGSRYRLRVGLDFPVIHDRWNTNSALGILDLLR